MTESKESIEVRAKRLHAGGVIDMHFDLAMDLYEKRGRSNVLAAEFLPDFEAGGMGIIGAAIYIEDRYLPDRGLQVALDQIARLYTEAGQSKRCVVCRTHEEISRALDSQKIGFLITMEGIEPLGAHHQRRQLPGRGEPSSDPGQWAKHARERYENQRSS